jgi:hypothetical protein
MTRGDFFLMCVQTAVLRTSITMHQALSVLGDASRVPEEALGTMAPAEAAMHFVYWTLAKQQGKEGERGQWKKPEWLEAWEEGRKNRRLIRANPAAAGGMWWANAEEVLLKVTEQDVEDDVIPFPKECVPLMTSRRELVVSTEGARLFEAWTQTIPGHEEEPFFYGDPPGDA